MKIDADKNSVVCIHKSFNICKMKCVLESIISLSLLRRLCTQVIFIAPKANSS